MKLGVALRQRQVRPVHFGSVEHHRPVLRVKAGSETHPPSSSSTNTNQPTDTTSTAATTTSSSSAISKFDWKFDISAPKKQDPKVRELPVASIRRPLGRTRANNEEKVLALMESIQQIGLQEPIDVLEVEGQYYGFSGCHRYEAHQRLGLPTILARVRKANREVLKMHMM